MEIRVKMDCEGCERKMRKSVAAMKGANQVEVDRKQHRLTVVGYVEPKVVMEQVRHRTVKRAEMWQYVPYESVTPGVYNRKAPRGT